MSAVDLIGTAVAAAAGTLVGGWLTLRAASKQIAAQEKAVARNGAIGMLDRLDELRAALPLLRGVATVDPAAGQTFDSVREQLLDAQRALATFKRGLNTDVLLVTDADLIQRCRVLARIAEEFANWRHANEAMADRARDDTENYARYVLYSLRQYISGKPLPAAADPPQLKRSADLLDPWTLEDPPADWHEI